MGCHSAADGGAGSAGAWLRRGSRPTARGRAAPAGPKRSRRARLSHLGHIWGTSRARVLRGQEAVRVCNSTDVRTCMWSSYGWRSLLLNSKAKLSVERGGHN
ncbi:hypothetical protein Nmel_011929 [Mimus melanotis]